MVASPVFFDLPSFLMELDSQYGQDSIGMEFMNSISSLDGLRCFASYHSEMVETNILDDPNVSENLAFRASSWFIFIIGGSGERFPGTANLQKCQHSQLLKIILPLSSLFRPCFDESHSDMFPRIRFDSSSVSLSLENWDFKVLGPYGLLLLFMCGGFYHWWANKEKPPSLRALFVHQRISFCHW